jgi:lipopolysaccharide exporter
MGTAAAARARHATMPRAVRRLAKAAAVKSITTNPRALRLRDTVPIKSPSAPTGLAGGAALMVLFRLLDRAIGVLSVLLLARLLTPADFGLVAMAMSVVALIELMSAFGFDTALIQRADIERKHMDTAWTFQLIFGVATAALLLLIAVPAASFYQDPRIASILPVLALSSLLGGLANIGPVMFRKQLDFAREFKFLLAKRLVGFLATLAAALLLRNYWALVVGMVVGAAASLAISYALHPYRPRPSLAASAELLHFSKWIFVSSLVQYVQGHADRLILGRMVGARELGLYGLAQEVATLPSTAVIAPINRAVFPAYAALNQDLAALQARFISVMGVVVALALPLSAALAMLAAPTVALLLGPQWTGSEKLLPWFVVAGLIGALQGNLYALIVALGQPQKSTLILCIVTAVQLPLLALASMRYGVVGAAAAHAAAALLGLVPLHVVFFRLTRFSWRGYLRCFPRPLLACAAAALALAGFEHVAPRGLLAWPLLHLMLGGACFALSYVLALGLQWLLAGRPTAGPEHEAMLRLTSFVQRHARDGMPRQP